MGAPARRTPRGALGARCPRRLALPWVSTHGTGPAPPRGACHRHAASLAPLPRQAQRSHAAVSHTPVRTAVVRQRWTLYLEGELCEWGPPTAASARDPGEQRPCRCREPPPRDG